MKISLASDHAALDMKNFVAEYLKEKKIEVKDHGPFTKDRVDYPDFAKKVANDVLNEKDTLGILICGTGVGISIAANKHNGIRAVVCSEPYSARLSKEHNNTNILCFGARVVGEELAKMIVDEWLKATYEGDRHQKRLDKITEIEKSNN